MRAHSQHTASPATPPIHGGRQVSKTHLTTTQEREGHQRGRVLAVTLPTSEDQGTSHPLSHPAKQREREREKHWNDPPPPVTEPKRSLIQDRLGTRTLHSAPSLRKESREHENVHPPSQDQLGTRAFPSPTFRRKRGRKTPRLAPLPAPTTLMKCNGDGQTRRTEERKRVYRDTDERIQKAKEMF